MTNVNTDKNKVEEILTRGVHEVYTSTELRQKLLSGKQLHIKLGTDVTGANLHLGHAVQHRKLRDFQELGHKVTLIIGDFTTLVGDHSDKIDMRSETDLSQIREFEKQYEKQFFKTVLPEQTDIRHNSEWLAPLDFNDVIGLAKQFTIAQMLDRETFLIRYKNQTPIGLDEFLYPLMQGYDSVALNCDVEIGGTDQTFNLLAGRKLMENKGMTPQNAMALKLLIGSDGRPMGKSLKNYIPIMDTPNDMFGKIMASVDEVIFDYFEMVTRVPMSDIQEMRHEVEKGTNPMQFKKLLAKELVTFYHSEKEAIEAENYFKETVQEGVVREEDMLSVHPNPEDTLLQVIKSVDTGITSSEIKRMFAQGGIEVNGIKMEDPAKILKLNTGDQIKVGKRRYLKVA
ncbi:MAG: tyrosine--tRNA ligase [Patescibacteria group bacterium]|uniref:Tyrosine--tRNA ligase n=1 Tax=candidate division WWE3 bacterium TaxID=2053526 RepID=A0A955EBB8_UNCKA|nr:tyrosine--tRNA ligase [candidate division WWE3 bacterium]